MAVIDKDLGYKEIITNLKNTAKSVVVVGALKESGEYGEGISVADVAIWNEYGTSKIPKRPFLRQAVDMNGKEWESFAQNVLGKLIDRNIKVQQALKLIGVKAEADVKKMFVDGHFTANAPSTIKQKGSSTPLIDTGRLRQSIKHRIDKA